MVGHKLGEFAPTRTFFGHGARQESAKEEASEMGKQKAPPKQASNEARAVLRMLAHQPAEAQPGGAVDPRPAGREGAQTELHFSRKRIAGDVLKCLQSAIDNAENNHGLDIDSLVVAEAHVGKNLVMKRMHARARGRGVRIEKPFSQTHHRAARHIAGRANRGGRLMGQKVNPIGLRLGVNRTLTAAGTPTRAEFGRLLHEDIKIRKFLRDKLKQAGISQDHHRASAEEVPRHRSHRQPGRGDRQEGRGHRKAPQGTRAGCARTKCS